MNKYIFLGTDTSVGKTLVMAGVARRLYTAGSKVALFKPVQSGGVRDSNGNILYTDADVLSLAIDNSLSAEVIAPWRFERDVAPFILLEEEKQNISLDSVLEHFYRLAIGSEVVLVEGAGGVAIPLFGTTNAVDLLKILDLTPVIVGRLGLGTINHTLLTIEYLRARGVEPFGVVLTETNVGGVQDPLMRKNPDIIKRLGNIQILGIIPYQGDFSEFAPTTDILESIGYLIQQLCDK